MPIDTSSVVPKLLPADDDTTATDTTSEATPKVAVAEPAKPSESAEPTGSKPATADATSAVAAPATSAPIVIVRKTSTAKIDATLSDGSPSKVHLLHVLRF